MTIDRTVKKMLQGKYSLAQLGINLGELRELKGKGFNVKSERDEDGVTRYWIKMMDDNNQYIISPRNGKTKTIEWAEVSDIHAGCYAFDDKGLRWFLQQCKDRGIRYIHNSGDSVDGTGVYRGHVNYLRYVKEEDQVKCLADIIGEFEDDFKWLAIDGNHDMSWINKGAPSPNKLLADMVKDYIYIPGIGADKVVRADVIIEGVMKRLVHPWSGSGSAYAKSYPGQVYLRRCLDNGVQFEVGQKKYHLKLLQYGHLHFDMAYETFGVYVTHPLSFQKPNDFTEGKGLVGPRGGRITTLVINDGEILDFNSRSLKVPDTL